MLAMMSNRQDAHEVAGYDAKQHRIGKTVHEAATDLYFNDAMLVWVLRDSFNGAIDFRPQCIAKASTN